MRGIPKLIVVTMFAVLAFAACGDTSDEATTGTTTADQAAQTEQSVRAYCEKNGRLNEQQRAPTATELQELSDLAPAAIKRELDLVAERFAAKGPDAADDPAVTEALGKVDTWNEANCPP
jgi:hypothetical protein